MSARTRRDRERWDARHAGHEVIQGANAPRCRTCWRGDLDVDDVAIARAVAGMAPDGLTLAEQLAAVRILTERGASARQIAERLQVTPRTVTRHRSRLRALGPDWAVAA